MEGEQPANGSFRDAARNYDGTSKLFRQLARYGGEIADLRRKGASYDTISELLKIDGVTVSWKTVARFCHATLDIGRPRRRRVTPKTDSPAIQTNLHPAAGETGNGKVQAILKERRDAIGPWTHRKRGPRIADSKNL